MYFLCPTMLLIPPFLIRFPPDLLSSKCSLPELLVNVVSRPVLAIFRARWEENCDMSSSSGRHSLLKLDQSPLHTSTVPDTIFL